MLWPDLEAGWTALTRMQLTPELARIPVILCTTASEQVAEPAMAANLNRLGVQVVLKPFMVEDLLSAVKDALTARKLLNQVRLVQDDGAEPVVSTVPEGGSASFS